jgi:hypothetical protein
MRPFRMFIRLLLLPPMALMAALAMLLAIIAAAAAVLTVVGAVATAVVAYVKREEWTLPAFRWARDQSGQWSVTPWSSRGQSETVPEADSVRM